MVSVEEETVVLILTVMEETESAATEGKISQTKILLLNSCVRCFF